MLDIATNPVDTGLEVFDLQAAAPFAARNLHSRDVAMQMEGMRRLARAFVESPDTILQELVNAAVVLCGADSAGISLETEEKTDDRFYRWVATAGQYSGFLGAFLPRYPSACGICLERGTAQQFRVNQRFFDIMGIEAPLVTDGLLLPWQAGETRGTIFIMAHGRSEAFDNGDRRMMETLADFAAMAIRNQEQQRKLLRQASAAAAAEMANDLAHQINNPLQSLTNLAYMAAQGRFAGDSKSWGSQFSDDLKRLADLVAKLLALPSGSNSKSI